MNTITGLKVEVAALRKEISALKGTDKKNECAKNCAIEMLKHEVARHVETQMIHEDLQGVDKEKKAQRRRRSILDNICRERAGDFYIL